MHTAVQSRVLAGPAYVNSKSLTPSFFLGIIWYPLGKGAEGGSRKAEAWHAGDSKFISS